MKRNIKLSICMFLIAVSFSLVHPITTNYVNSLNLPTSYFGFFYAAMSLGQVIGAMFWPILAKKIRMIYLICIGMLGYCLCQLGFGFINTFPLLILLFRFFGGFFASSANIGIIAIAVATLPKDKRVKWLSILSALNLFGAALAYEISGDLYTYAHFTISQIFIFQVIFIIASIIFVLLLLVKEETERKENINVNNKKMDFSALRYVSFVGILYFIALFLMNLGQIDIQKYIDVVVIDKGYEPSDLGHYTFIAGIVGCLTNLLITPFLSRFNKKIIGIILVFMVIFSSIFAYLTFNINQGNLIIMLYSVFMIYTVLKAMIIPLEQSYLVEITSEERHTQVIGLRQSFISLGSIVGPLIGSAIYQKGEVTIFNISSIFILIAAFVFAISYLVNRKQIKR